MDVARTAPIEWLPSDVNVLALNSEDKARSLAQHFSTYLDWTRQH